MVFVYCLNQALPNQEINGMNALLAFSQIYVEYAKSMVFTGSLLQNVRCRTSLCSLRPTKTFNWLLWISQTHPYLPMGIYWENY